VAREARIKGRVKKVLTMPGWIFFSVHRMDLILLDMTCGCSPLVGPSSHILAIPKRGDVSRASTPAA
jgi:hypothetical protein